MGTGTSVVPGLVRRAHMGVSKIPNVDNLDTNWLQAELKKTLPGDAKIVAVEKLVPTDTTKTYSSKSMKVSIEYAGDFQDLYKGEYWPKGLTVRRFRFRRPNTGSGGPRNSNPASIPGATETMDTDRAAV